MIHVGNVVRRVVVARSQACNPGAKRIDGFCAVGRGFLTVVGRHAHSYPKPLFPTLDILTRRLEVSEVEVYSNAERFFC